MTTSITSLDTAGLPRVAGPVPREEAARQLESLFLGMLVKEMRQTLPGDGLFGGGAGASIYEGLFDSLMGDAMASGPGSGLREAILASLPEDAGSPPAGGAPAVREARS